MRSEAQSDANFFEENIPNFAYKNYSNFAFKLICIFKLGDPLRVGMDLTIASFDAISEVNMVS